MIFYKMYVTYLYTVEYNDQLLVKIQQLSCVQIHGPDQESSVDSEGLLHLFVLMFLEGYQQHFVGCLYELWHVHAETT